MSDKKEVISSIWEKAEVLEASASKKNKTALTPNKMLAIGFCCLIFLSISILLIGETAYWITLCFVPVAYFIDKYSWIEEVRNREAEFFDL